MPHQTSLPDDFMVNDRVREWSLKRFGYYHLPDFFLSDFRSHHAAKGTRMANWDLALMNWIRWSAPSGRYYQITVWEHAIQYCKERMNREKPKVEIPDLSPPKEKPVDREYGRKKLLELRARLAK